MQTNKKAPEGANKIFQADNNTISKECQLESFNKLDTAKRCRMILSQLDEPRTAREIAYRLGFSDLNAVKPRLSEMKARGTVEVIRKDKDSITKRNVSVFRRT
ncbi:MAG: hypothetical protein SPK45_00340 [Anaerovoracaceae bacterium]|nr:hypothetical protein [Anaerovoracaceae bacterium]